MNNDIYDNSEDGAIITREEYTVQLRNWISQVKTHNEQALNELFRSYAAHCNTQTTQAQSPNTLTNTNHSHNFVFVHTSRPSPDNRPGLYIYSVPPMWKRIMAEFIDFLILFVIKMLLTVVILESFDVINVENYGFNYIHKKFQNPKFGMSFEILLLEVLHRSIVCCYETYWLVVQCATPGKKYMGLAVVHAVNVSHLHGHPEHLVIAQPCTALTLKDALYRAILKNIFIGLLLPICFVLVFFKFNRTGYDLLAHSLVVDTNTNPMIQQNR